MFALTDEDLAWSFWFPGITVKQTKDASFSKILVCCGYLITYWQCEASVEINWTSCSNFIMPCNRLNQSKSWVLNAFLSWDLHNWHINMHEVPWKCKTEWAKWSCVLKLRPFPEGHLSFLCLLGRWSHLTDLETDRVAAAVPCSQCIAGHTGLKYSSGLWLCSLGSTTQSSFCIL